MGTLIENGDQICLTIVAPESGDVCDSCRNYTVITTQDTSNYPNYIKEIFISEQPGVDEILQLTSHNCMIGAQIGVITPCQRWYLVK